MIWYLINTGQFAYSQPEETYLEDTYYLTAGCTTCENGKALKNAFRFRSEPKAKHSQFLGLNWVLDEVFVREKDIVVRMKWRGLTFSHIKIISDKLVQQSAQPDAESAGELSR